MLKALLDFLDLSNMKMSAFGNAVTKLGLSICSNLFFGKLLVILECIDLICLGSH